MPQLQPWKTKQNTYSPGYHIPIKHPSNIYSLKPDYIIILAWNFAESIMKTQQKYSKQGGLFILPMPKPSIVKN